MKPITVKWIEKAESDYRVACRSLQAEPLPADVICFHAQQCIEKYAKAFLDAHGVPVEQTDSRMKTLYAQCLSIGSDFQAHESEFVRLDDFGIDILYPGHSASDDDALEATAILPHLRAFIRAKLGLE